MTPEEEINYWKERFSCLKDWHISYGDPGNALENKSGGVSLFKIGSSKFAKIKPWTDGNRPKDYIFHEIFHIVLYNVRTADDKGQAAYGVEEFADDLEEGIVRDMCRELFSAH